MESILFVFFFLLSCGGGTYNLPQPPAANDPREQRWKATVQPVTDKFCRGCHANDGFVNNAASFVGSKAQTRVGNKSMPPASSPAAAAMTDADRAVITSFK
jgi:hypothetical protein